jgi:putative membrane protein
MEKKTTDKKPSSLLAWIKEFIVGFCIGVANIIPGVSGGTFLLIFGIYERVIGILNGFTPKVIKDGIGLVYNIVRQSGRKKSIPAFGSFLETYDIAFIMRLLAGAATAIVVLSSIMKMLLTKQFSITYAFFFGLILTSIIIPYRLMRSRKAVHIFFFALGTVLTLYVTLAVNPYEKAKGKSDHYKELMQTTQNASAQPVENRSDRFRYTGRYTTTEYLYTALCGAIAISAMVLPGISGSFVLILMGNYFEVISAIASLKTLVLDYIVFLSVFSLGMLIGLYFFAKLVDFVFKRYYDGTMAFLTGLMVGSLYTIWPFKQYVIMDQYVKNSGTIDIVKDAVVYTNINTLPDNAGQLVAALCSCTAGMIIMVFFVKKENG